MKRPRPQLKGKLLVVGEALNQISKSKPDVKRQITDFKKIVSFRNILVHSYFGIDDRIVWDVLTTKLDQLRSEIEKLNLIIPALSPVPQSIEFVLEQTAFQLAVGKRDAGAGGKTNALARLWIAGERPGTPTAPVAFEVFLPSKNRVLPYLPHRGAFRRADWKAQPPALSLEG